MFFAFAVQFSVIRLELTVKTAALPTVLRCSDAGLQRTGHYCSADTLIL